MQGVVLDIVHLARTNNSFPKFVVSDVLESFIKSADFPIGVFAFFPEQAGYIFYDAFQG
jgi:hypothetical protein